MAPPTGCAAGSPRTAAIAGGLALSALVFDLGRPGKSGVSVTLLTFILSGVGCGTRQGSVSMGLAALKLDDEPGITELTSEPTRWLHPCDRVACERGSDERRHVRAEPAAAWRAGTPAWRDR